MFAVLGLLGAVFVVGGTGIQAVLALRELDGELSRPAVAVRELRDEFPWWRHPFRRRAQLALVRELLQRSPDEAAAYRRVEWHLRAWSFMFVGSVCAVVGLLGAR